MSKIIIGAPGAHEQPKQYGFRQQGGHFTRRIWKCTDIESAQALIPGLLDARYSYTITEGPIPTVEAEISSIAGGDNNEVEVPTDSWEKTSVAVNIDVLDTPYARNNLNDFDFETFNEYKKTGAPLTSAEKTGLGAYGLRWYNMIASGVTSKTVFQPVLRHTQIVSSGYPLNWPDTNSEKILTNAQLSAEGLPGDLRFSIPSSGTDTDVIIGWLKLPATIQSSGNGTWVVTQEYQYGRWIDLIYEWA